MQGAIPAAAYDDTRALAVMLDSTDDNIKAISNAMLAAAPAFAKLKAEISAGRVSSEFDITDNVTDVANKISNARKNGVKVAELLAQQDAFTRMDPITEALIKAFYNDQLTRAKSQKFMTDVLRFYTQKRLPRNNRAVSLKIRQQQKILSR